MVWAVCYWVGPTNQCDLGNTVQAACRALLTGTCIQTASVAKIRQLSIQLVAAAVNQLQMCLNFCLISRSLYWSSDIKTDWNTLVSMWQTAQNRSPWRIPSVLFYIQMRKTLERTQAPGTKNAMRRFERGGIVQFQVSFVRICCITVLTQVFLVTWYE